MRRIVLFFTGSYMGRGAHSEPGEALLFLTMAKDPAFLFYPGDYLRDTQCLSEKAQVAYDRIMCEHMRNICITQQQLDFFTKRLNDSEKFEIISVLVKKLDCYQIPWIVESIEKRREYSDSRRKNRSGKPEKPTQSYDSHILTYDSHMENENESVIENEIKEGNTNSEKSEIQVWPTFDDWWDAYSKKIDRPKCEKKWKKISQGAREKIMSHTEDYVKSTPDLQYRKHPATYLNNESWNNEIVIPTNGKQTQHDKLSAAMQRVNEYTKGRITKP